MRDLARRETARSDLVLFGACVALSLVALAMPRPWAAALAAAVRRTALRPLVALQSRAEAERISRFELTKIEHDRDSLALRVQDGAEIARENANLRNILALRPRLSQPFVPAEVLHRPAVTDDRMVLLSVGTAQGVKQFDPIVAPEGLVGYVWNAGPYASSAYTWAHPEFRAAATTADGRVSGFIAASPSTDASRTVLELRGVALRDSLKPGTVVITSGLGGVFPRGIPIGRVTSVQRDLVGYERIYRVIPFAHPALMSHVMVLTAPRDSLYLSLPAGDSAQ